MNNEPTPIAAANGAAEQLQAECARLRQQVQELEAERRQHHEALAALRKERDEYLRALYKVACARLEGEDWTALDENDALPLEAFQAELDEIVRQAQSDAAHG